MITRCLGLFLIIAIFAIPSLAQEALKLQDLTASEFAALERVTEGSVTGTISFLASDELGGRGTPSKELTIATAYVASRLRAAGAEGLGPAGSYYLESSIDTVQTASHGCRLVHQASNLEIPVRLLEGAVQAFNYQGGIVQVESPSQLPAGFSGPVVSGLDESSNEPPSQQLRRLTRSLAASGATAVLIECSKESSLWSLAEQMQSNPRVESARNRYELPVILVGPENLPEGGEFSLSVPANENRPSTVRNVIGVLRGSDPQLAKQAILFSAHLDHLGAGAPGPDTIYNGADDDASGVTGVLTLADALGALKPAPKRSMVFVTFWGEERGLLGSKHFVEHSPWPMEDIVANINIEMIGRPEVGAVNKCWMTGWDQSDLGKLMAQGSRRLGVETFEHPSYSARLYRASDNFSFVQKGVIAHSFSAGSLHSDYHQPSDHWQSLNLVHMTQVIRGIYAGVLPIAQGEWTPKKAK